MKLKFYGLDELKLFQASVTDYEKETMEIHAEFEQGKSDSRTIYVVQINTKETAKP